MSHVEVKLLWQHFNIPVVIIIIFNDTNDNNNNNSNLSLIV